MRLSVADPSTPRFLDLEVWYSVSVVSEIYRTAGGLVMRVIEADDGGLRVETLNEDEWVAGRIGMAGLRLSPSTTKLTAQQAKKLPE
jgi:hypothetical protein